MHKNKAALIVTVGIISYFVCYATQENINYQKMCRERVCVLENIAGKQPQRICDLVYRLEQSLIDPAVYENAVILYGPPGTGKTLLAQAIAQQAGAILITCSASSIITKWQGCGARGIKKQFKKAQKHLDKNEKVVLFIDEVDCISRERTAQANEDNIAALMELNVKVTEYEKEPRLLVIVATNKEKILDSALLSRFERLEIPLPDYQLSMALFSYFLKNFSHELDEHIPQFARRAVQAKMSCRDIRKVVTEAYWQSKAVGSSKVLSEAMDDKIELMVQKKMQEREEKEKEEEKERKMREITELQHRSLQEDEYDRIFRKMRRERDVAASAEEDHQLEELQEAGQGIQDTVAAFQKLKRMIS